MIGFCITIIHLVNLNSEHIVVVVFTGVVFSMSDAEYRRIRADSSGDRVKSLKCIDELRGHEVAHLYTGSGCTVIAVTRAGALFTWYLCLYLTL